MLRNYLKIAWRNLLRNKVLSFINIFGLAIGMTFAMLIGLWVRYELSFDTFHENAGRLAVVERHTLFNNIKGTNIAGMLPLSGELRTNWPDVKRVSRMDWENMHGIMAGNTKFQKNGTFVDPDFLKMFTFPLVKGNVETALKEPNSIILTESLAKALFGNAEPMGKVVRIDNRYNVQVTAIAKDVPKNSTIGFEFLAPYEFLMQNESWRKENAASWGNNFLRTVVELKEGTTPEAFSAKIKNLLITKDKRITDQTLFLFPMRDWHLRDQFKDWANVGGKIDYVRLFGIIGIFVLLIACINFMNLSTANASKRAREVGVRKVLGSAKLDLVRQFLLESILLTAVALVLAVVVSQVALPVFNGLAGKNLTLGLTSNPVVWPALLGLGLLVGVVAGSYPAFYLSSFKPVAVLKGRVSGSRKSIGLRSGLVVFQFTVSIFLIVGTTVVYRQLNYMRDKNLGYDKEQLLVLPNSWALGKNETVFRDQLLADARVVNATISAYKPAGPTNSNNSLAYPDGKDAQLMRTLRYGIDDRYIPTMGMRMVSGRNFSGRLASDSSGIIINETAANAFGWGKNAVGRTVTRLTDNDGGKKVYQVIGVVGDFHFKSLHESISPLLMVLENNPGLIVKVRTNEMAGFLASVKTQWDAFGADEPFTYAFMDELVGKTYQAEQKVGIILNIFTLLTIFIACLGLFGLATFTAEQRTKEIGIRKVLGASVMGIAGLLSKDFLKLVLVACVLSFPLAWYAMNQWMENFAYRIDISWWVFALAGVLALLIALLTVSFQAIKAALANPVKSLRSE